MEVRRAVREARERDIRARLAGLNPRNGNNAADVVDREEFTSVPLRNSDEDEDDGKNDMDIDTPEKASIKQVLASGGVHPFWKHPVDGRTLRKGFEKRMTPSQQEKWLQSSASWPDTPASEWKGVKVLGLGGYGLVGLWKYLGSDPNMPKAIVVKQSPHVDLSLQHESDFLDMLNISGSKHVPRLFKGFHTEVGTGSSDWDLKGKPVSRIYLEYCEHGDMAGFIQRMYDRYSTQNPMPEAYIWRIFECLALALCVVAHGNENLEGPSWQTEMVHFDIKPQNSKCSPDDGYYNKMLMCHSSHWRL
ncbi:hypothetical protein F5884DRAFT_303896 [Xylogone sp. PMI_703]|nr:hypothetical protein F5884DRAFT_303896 [Xylogone sp. PMI_703]